MLTDSNVLSNHDGEKSKDGVVVSELRQLLCNLSAKSYTSLHVVKGNVDEVCV